MLTAQTAILALLSAMVAKMAKADDPNWKPLPEGAHIFTQWNRPTVWTVNLDQMVRIDAILNGETVSVSAAEVFAALRDRC
jgi:hypothetical protein